MCLQLDLACKRLGISRIRISCVAFQRSRFMCVCFLQAVMVEKILRVQPDVGQLYLVIQPQKGLSADDRLKKNVRIIRLCIALLRITLSCWGCCQVP